MTSRQNTIIVELGTAGEFVTAAQLVRAMQGAPWASIRRNVAVLRTKGYDIQAVTEGGTTGYRLVPTVTAYDTNIDAADEDGGWDALEGEDDDFFDDGGW